MPEYVSGWDSNDGKYVYLVERNDDGSVNARRIPAKWSAFVRGLNADDKLTLARDPRVVGLKDDEHGYTRLDFANRWERRDITMQLQAIVDVQRISGYGTGDEGVYEADVSPLRRLLSDHPTVQISSKFLCGYFDLETDSRKSFDQAKNGEARILSWAIYNADRTWSMERCLESDTDIAERALISEFFETIERFDVMLAWNGYGFDFPVLECRTKRLRATLPNGRLPFWQRWCWLDHMEVFKKYNQAHDSGEERASFSLNSIAQHTLGVGKDTFDARYTWEAWEAGGERREELRRYNLRDTELMPMIEDKTGFVALHLAVCQATRCFPDTQSLGAAQQGDGFLLALGAKHGYRFATKKYGEMEESHFAGAYVMPPKKLGLIRDVHVCDFAGLYPSIMRSWNMSPDTAVPRNAVPTAPFPVCRLPDRPVHFRTDKRGIIPLALDTLIAQRAEYTKKADAAEPGSPDWDRYKRLSSAFKIVANSFYGIVGSPFTRFFDRTIAEGVTQTGAWLIKRVASASENAGLTAFYGDTDSCFVQGDGPTFGKIVEELNASWPATLTELGCTESRIKLEFEKSYRSLILISAKRYAARYAMYKGKPAPADMKPEVKGLEYKRGDALRLAREMQAEAIKLLLRDESATIEEMRAFVESWRTRVLEGELVIADVLMSQSVKDLSEYSQRYTTDRCATKKGVGKNAVACGYQFPSTHISTRPSCPKCKAERKIASQPAHVRVAHVLKARGEEIMQGTRIEYLVVLPAEGEESDGKLIAVPAHDPGMLERVDRMYYWKDRILAPTQRVLEKVFPQIDWSEKKAPKEPAPRAPKTKAKREMVNGRGTLGLFASRAEVDDGCD